MKKCISILTQFRMHMKVPGYVMFI